MSHRNRKIPDVFGRNLLQEDGADPDFWCNATDFYLDGDVLTFKCEWKVAYNEPKRLIKEWEAGENGNSKAGKNDRNA